MCAEYIEKFTDLGLLRIAEKAGYDMDNLSQIYEAQRAALIKFGMNHPYHTLRVQSGACTPKSPLVEIFF